MSLIGICKTCTCKKACNTEQNQNWPKAPVPFDEFNCRGFAGSPFIPYLQAKPTLIKENQKDKEIVSAMRIQQIRYYRMAYKRVRHSLFCPYFGPFPRYIPASLSIKKNIFPLEGLTITAGR